MRVLKPVLLAVVVLPALHTGAHAAFGIPSPTQLILDLVGKITGGAVTATGVSGWPNALHVDRLELRDAEGAWLIAEDVTLDWHPYRLATKEAAIDKVTAARLSIPRLQAASPTPAAPSSGPPSLPVSIDVKSLHVDRVELGAPVAGVAAAFSLDGSLALPTLLTPTAHLLAARLDQPGGTYKIDGAVTDQTIDATVAIAEPKNGFIAQLAHLPDIGALALDAAVNGPRTALATKLTLGAGPLKAAASGTVDLPGETLDLHVTGSAPAMKPAPEVSWQSIALNADVKGPFTKPDANGHFQIDQLAAAGAAIRQLTADLSGNEGKVTVHAAATGLQAPLPKPDLLAADPLTLDATAVLDDPARPVSFTLAHPLFSATGRAETAGSPKLAMDLKVPQLTPFTQLAGVDLQGHTAVHIDAAQLPDSTLTLTGDGTLAISSGLAPLPGLIGEDAKVGLTMRQHGQDLTISRMTVDGRTVQLALTGGQVAGQLTGSIKAALSDLSVVAPTLTGTVAATVDLSGTQTDLAMKAHAQGDIRGARVPRGPVTVDIAATGLPSAPSGTIKASGSLAGAPLDLAVDAQRGADGAVKATIQRADWRSLHADGRAAARAGRHATARSCPAAGWASWGTSGRSSARRSPARSMPRWTSRPTSCGCRRMRPARAFRARAIGSAKINARVHDPLGTPVVTASADRGGDRRGGGDRFGEACRHRSAIRARHPHRRRADAVRHAGADQRRRAARRAGQVGPAEHVAGRGQGADRPLAGARRRCGSAGRSRSTGCASALQNAVLDVAGQLSPRLDATVTVRAPGQPGRDRLAGPEARRARSRSMPS